MYRIHHGFQFVELGGQSGTVSGVNWDAVLPVVLGLLLFGIGYNALIHWLHRRGLNEGYVWLEVVVGVVVTLAAASFVVGWQTAMTLFLLFAAAGVAPAFGDMYRYVKARRAEISEESR